MLTPPHPKRIHTRGLFKCPQRQQGFRQYARHVGRQKAHNGEKPQQVCKKLLTELWLPYSSEKPYWWKCVYLSWMWQKHELESLLGFAPKKPNPRKDLTKYLSEKNCQCSALMVHQGTQISENPLESEKSLAGNSYLTGSQRTYSVENFAPARDLIVDCVHIIGNSWPVW